MVAPWLAWIAVATSAALLVMLHATGDLGARALAVLLPCFVIAAICQFFGTTNLVATGGLVLQTVLAVGLVIRWKASVL